MANPALDGTAGKALISNASSGSVALAAATSNADDLLVVVIAASAHGSAAAAPPTVSSVATSGLTWTKQKALTSSSASEGDLEIWTAPVTATGTFSTTVTLSKSGDAVLLLFALQGYNTSTPEDPNSSNPASATGSSTAPSSSISTSNANDMLIGAMCQFGFVAGTSLTDSPGTGYTNIINDVTSNAKSGGKQLDNIEADVEYLDVSGTQASKAVNFTLGASEAWITIALAIEAVPTTNVNLSETGSGLDAISIQNELDLADSGSGADVISIENEFSLSDLGSGSDSVSIQTQFTLGDSGSGVDSIGIAEEEQLGLSEFGSGNDAVSVQVTEVDTGLSESGSGIDTVSVTIQSAGGATRVILID